MGKMMGSMYSRNTAEYPPENSTLKRIFDLYVEETITDEQVERVLMPVRRMINEGKFNKPRRFQWLAQPLTMTAAVVAVTVSVTLAQNKMLQSAFVNIPNSAPPLAGSIPAEDTPTDRVALMIRGANGADMILMNIDSKEIYNPKFIANDGTFTFEDIPEGTYKIIASPPLDVASTDGGTWVVADGKAEPVTGGNPEKIWEGVDVQVCQAE